MHMEYNDLQVIDHEEDIYENDPIEDNEDTVDYLIYDDGYIEQEPRWTKRRVIYFVIALVIIIVMVLAIVAPLLMTIANPAPTYMPPPATPPSQL